MKVNFVLPPIGSSGGIDVIYKYVDLLQKSGYDVCVYKAILANNMHRYHSNVKNIIHQIYCTAKTVFEKKNIEERRIVLSGKYVIKLSVMRM